MKIVPSGEACGAQVTGIDLSQPLAADTVTTLRAAWLQHLVLSFPDQQLSDDDLERFTLAFGSFGEDPFIAPLPGRAHVIAIRRAADETTPIFAEAWHTDWSFQAVPPDGTCLYGITIPPVGGDTLFANQQKALAEMPAGLRVRLEGVTAVHSARAGYAPDGVYGENDKGRSMDIRPSEAAEAVQRHPLIRPHPETGVPAIYGAPGYVVALEGTDDAQALMMELYQWQTQERFVYRHRWQPDMLIMWDNRALLHRATGGYDGHDRLLHRTTIGGVRF
jgi:taurine dioxygenase